MKTRTQEKDREMTKAEVRVTQPQTKEGQGLLATTKSWKKQGGILSRVSERARPCRHRDQTSSLRMFVVFKSPGVWYVVTAEGQ